jgi:hypothetical protein
MTIAAIALIALLGALSAWGHQRLRGQAAALPPDARRRMTTVFPAVMGLIIVMTFIAIYLLRPHV